MPVPGRLARSAVSGSIFSVSARRTWNCSYNTRMVFESLAVMVSIQFSLQTVKASGLRVQRELTHLDLRRSLQLSLRPPTPVLHSVLLRRIAPLRLGLPVELPALHVIDATFAGVRREVPLDRVSEGARPGILWRDARAHWSLRRRCGRDQHQGG